MTGMSSSTLSLAAAALAATPLLARAMASVAREARNCLLLWLALRGTRPEQRSPVIQVLPPLDPQRPTPARKGVGIRRFDDTHAKHAETARKNGQQGMKHTSERSDPGVD
jgi:hypothetical protein